MNSENATKSLVDAALLSAITVVIYVIARYIPIIDVLFLLCAHLPLVVAFSRHGGKYATFSALVSAVLIFFLLGPLYALGFVFTSVIVGMVLGYYSRKNESSIVVIGVVSLCILISTGILIKLTTLITGIDILTQTIDSVLKSTEISLNTLKEAGVGGVVGNFDIGALKTYFQISIPGMAITTSAILACVYYVITQKFLKKLKVKLDPIKEFSTWYIPGRVAYPVMLLMLGNMFLSGDELTPIAYAIRTIFVMVFTVNALATVSYYLKRSNVAKPLIAVILIVIFLMLQSILLFVGLIEYALNIRGLDKKRPSILFKK